MRRLQFQQHILYIVLCIVCLTSHAQTAPNITFFPLEKDSLCFDSQDRQIWWGNYDNINLSDSSQFNVPNISVGFQQNDTIGVRFNTLAAADKRKLITTIDGKIVPLTFIWRSTNSLLIQLPKKDKNYSLQLYVEDQLIGQLNVYVFPPKNVALILVPLMDCDINTDSLQSFLNHVYTPSRLHFDVHMTEKFGYSFSSKDSLLTNPSEDSDRYTDQMIEIRDTYFERHPKADKHAYYAFILPGFVHSSVKGYMVRNKALAFIAYPNERNLHRTIAQQLGYGAGALRRSWKSGGPTIGNSVNLMDTNRSIFTVAEQWELIHFNSLSFSYFDEYEDVKTNSGFVANYFWQEDSKGRIFLPEEGFLKAIRRPYKKNQYSLHLEIENWLFIPLFKAWKFDICLLHILSLLALLILSALLRRWIVRKKLQRTLERRRFFRFMIRIFFFGLFLISFYCVFALVNQGYFLFEKKWGALRYLEGKPLKAAIKEVNAHRDTRTSNLVKPSSEILIQKGAKWILKRRKKVLYFDAYNKNDKLHYCVFKGDSDSLKVKSQDFSDIAESHYLVVNYHQEDSTLIEQRVFNHLGVNVTEKLHLDDPSKRIVLFVNGYRPTSLGKTFEENFSDIQKNGLEFANSNNLIYDFDRYEYWNPWNKMDDQFKERLNPDETFYADGHFSVATSNHKSLLNFTTISGVYPKRCKDPMNHVCRKTSSYWNFTGIESYYDTYEQLNTVPNSKGFEARRTHGNIAGKNLYQMLNELPNNSSNDTLFIVAHSMGYAYALGMVDALHGKVNFGGFYIIAAENATAGSVNIDDWKEVWQYGSDFDGHKYTAPCLLDGIAPQVKAGGLTPQHRLFIPEEHYRKQGFFDSHFIGYYTWILDIPEGSKGHIRQH